MLNRWLPALTMTLVSLISYIDRNTLALLAPTILAETHLNAEQYGYIITAFSIAYMIGNPAWGRLLDRFGIAFGMVVAVGFWTLASVSHAFASGFWSFAIARAALGFGEGATFPGGLRTVVQTLEPAVRSRGVAVAFSGGSLGAVVTPIIVTPIALVWGWRGAFWFTGLVGAAWLAIWLVVSRREDIRRRPQAAPKASSPRLADPRLWSFMLIYAFGCLPLGFVLYGCPIYLSKGLGLSQADIGKLLWIPPIGWEIGYFFWGWQMDRAGRTDPSIAVFRRFFPFLAVLSLPLALATRAGSVPSVMALLFFAMFIAGGFIIVSVAYGTRVYTGAHAGFLAGISSGAWSAAVGLTMPYFGRLFDQRHFELAFVIAAVIPVIGWLAWWALQAKGGGE